MFFKKVSFLYLLIINAIFGLLLLSSAAYAQRILLSSPYLAGRLVPEAYAAGTLSLFQAMSYYTTGFSNRFGPYLGVTAPSYPYQNPLAMPLSTYYVSPQSLSSAVYPAYQGYPSAYQGYPTSSYQGYPSDYLRYSASYQNYPTPYWGYTSAYPGYYQGYTTAYQASLPYQGGAYAASGGYIVPNVYAPSGYTFGSSGHIPFVFSQNPPLLPVVQLADVMLDQDDNKKLVKIDRGKTLSIMLPSKYLADYRWELDIVSLNTDVARKKGWQLLPPVIPTSKAIWYEQWIFETLNAGTTTISLKYRRYWETIFASTRCSPYLKLGEVDKLQGKGIEVKDN
ncbi:MAG: protease inhibitor I42 family protein, partial [bacterium]|nr:protease inhibitor I42 family protein [bacterium]